MPKKRRAESKRRVAAADPAPAPDRLGAAAVAILSLLLVATSLAVDLTAGAAFDAPKRALALLGTALAAAVALVGLAVGRGESPVSRSPLRRWMEAPALSRASAALALAALAGSLLAALASPRREISLDALRSIALLALLLPLGASDAVARRRGWLAGAFLAACAVNAAVSILQGTGRYRPFALETAGSREDTGAFAGNVGYLAIAVALASVLAAALLAAPLRRPVRLLAGAALALFAADLLVNRNLTALTSAGAGIAAWLVVRFRRRAALPLLGTLLAGAALVAAYPPLRARAGLAYTLFREGDWNTLLSYRGGPWAAALEMVRERPLGGFGPGTFGAEYVPHRLSAEIRARRRFVSPLLTTSYAEAHSDYLQVATDCGIVVALLAVGAAGCLLAAVARAAWGSRSGFGSGFESPEAALLLAFLVAGAVAALTWFPLQRPITAAPLLLAAGRAWRVGRDAGGPAAAGAEVA